ncbi:MAG: TIGR02147 family protein [Proteobacteria bacterium]|nr:MAG: TIGR02147 family protein [Pseudomonadota bacterium]
MVQSHCLRRSESSIPRRMSSKEPSHNHKTSSGKDFCRFLRQELVRRCDRRPSYSLRAFSRDLGVNHATLSSILAGKRPLTEKSIVKLSQALELTRKEKEDFLNFRASTTAGSPGFTEHQTLALDVFAVTADWYHDAILELTHTMSFRPNVRWIATRLGISTTEVRLACERLERLELLLIEGTKWTDCSRNNTTNLSNDLTSAALRKLQAKILEMSQKALAEMPRTKRDHTSVVVAMQESDLAEVKERIKKFRFEIVKFIERKQAEPDGVYQFAFSVFPLTKEESVKGNE